MKQIKHFQVIRLQYSSRGNYECHYLSHTVTHSTLDKKVEECDSQDLTSEEDKDHLVTAIKHGDTSQVSKWESALSLALHQEDPVMVTVIDEKVSSVY